MVRYYEYCKDQKYLDSIFTRFDVDKSGTLQHMELPALLKAVAPEGTAVTHADIVYIFEQCDENGDGVISRDEVLPMLASWIRVASDRDTSEKKGLAAHPHALNRTRSQLIKSWGGTQNIAVVESPARVAPAPESTAAGVAAAGNGAKQRSRQPGCSLAPACATCKVSLRNL